MHKRRHGRVRAQGVAGHLRVGATFTPGATVENISGGGAFVRTHDVLPLGTAVVVDLVRPGLKKALRLSGRVASSISFEDAKARRAVPGMGIQFDPHPADVSERLAELLKLLAPGEKVLEGDPLEAAPPRPSPLVTKQPAIALEPAAPGRDHAVAVPESARLMVQVKGLLMELGDSQSRTSTLERENEALRAELERLRAELARARPRQQGAE